MKKISIILIVIMIVTIPATSFAINENEQITRSEFVKEILTQTNMDINQVEESSFIDVKDPDVIPYIETAYNNGYISGYNQSFKPDEPITKEQATIIISRAFGGYNNLTSEDIEDILNFTDKASISPWAKSYVANAIEKELIKAYVDSFYARKLLTRKEANRIISEAKKSYENIYTREGLTAAELLVLSNENMLKYDTYKQKGTMDMKMQMNIDGIPKEEVENNQDIQMLIDEGTNMTIDMEIEVQNPDKYYIKEVISATQMAEAISQEIEIFMDGPIMYTKMMDSDSWIKQDLSGIMNQMKSLSSNEPYQMTQLSEEQLNFFKKFARFDDIENSDEYVISVDIDKDSYREYYMEVLEKTMDAIVELQVNNPQYQQDSSFDEEQFRKMMVQLMSDLDIEVQYKFFIDKDTKDYKKMEVVQDLYMSMDNLLAMVENMVEGEKENLSVEMITQTEGEFNYYEFNEKVNFPEIQPEDLLQPVQ